MAGNDRELKLPRASDAEVPSPDATPTRDEDTAQADGLAAGQRLVMRCLAGESGAWEQLWRVYHPQMLDAIQVLAGTDVSDASLVEEIAARVWYALLRDRARLLARYDPERDSSLSAFFMGLARIEIMRHKRSERRRKRHEMNGGCKPLEDEGPNDWEVHSIIEEFAATLTQSERQFMQEHLTSVHQGKNGEDVLGLPSSTVWQRRHRIRSKLHAFLRDLW